MKYALIGVFIVGLISLLPSAMAQERCPNGIEDTITVPEGALVTVVLDEPCDPTYYDYYWEIDYDLGIGDFGGLPEMDACSVTVRAPTVSGSDCEEYIVSVDVMVEGYSSCVETQCVKIVVCPLQCDCPIDPDSFCWQDFTSKTYTYDCDEYQADDMYTVWTLNGDTIPSSGDDLSMTIDHAYIEGYGNYPTSNGDIQNNEVCFYVYDNDNRLLFSCCGNLDFVYEPDTTIHADGPEIEQPEDDE